MNELKTSLLKQHTEYDESLGNKLLDNKGGLGNGSKIWKEEKNARHLWILGERSPTAG